MLYLVRLRNNGLVTADVQVGSRLPAVGPSIGRVLPAGHDDTELEQH
ncbi:hypothetical protein [Streptomyces sp. 4F14]